VEEAARVLEPGGQLVYSDFHPAWRENGWRRTFRAGRRLVELAFFPHSIDHHLERISRAGLAVRVIREPRIVQRSAPVVAVFHAIKPGASVRHRR
jgi:malonyl-CoA O-methyltransferase